MIMVDWKLTMVLAPGPWLAMPPCRSGAFLLQLYLVLNNLMISICFLPGDPSGHIKMGLWVLAGILVFLIIEKIFPDGEEEDEEEEDTKVGRVLHSFDVVLSASGPRFNIKMSSYQYRKSHCGDKTVVKSSYLHNGISYTGKTTSLYWIRTQVLEY